MNLVYGELVEILEEDRMRVAKIRIGGVLKKIPLALLTDAKAGDRVLICDGVAISKVEKHVSGDSGKAC
jgi:hydrogenase maturation factor